MTQVKLLIVEDDWLVAEDTKNKLNDLGYAVTAMVSSGEEAIEKVEKYAPDLVLMDIVLKGEMDGIEAAEKIHTRFDIPVLYLTAYADEQLLERAKITEPFGYIIKPLEDAALHTAIEIALYKHKMEKRIRGKEHYYRSLLYNL
jgi:CheY-like chemotaxis protein